MALKKESLEKFLKKLNLKILSIEDDSSENTQIFKLTLAEPVVAVGSNVTDTGMEMRMPNVTTVYVAADDFEKFKEEAEEVDDIIVYKGTMKLDVSRPNGRLDPAGKFIITKPSKAWLVAIAFNKRGAGLVNTRRQALSDAVATIYGKINADGTIIAPAHLAENVKGAIVPPAILEAVDTGMARK